MKGVDKNDFDYSKVCRSPPKHAFCSCYIFPTELLSSCDYIEVLSTGFNIKLRRKLKKTHPAGETSVSQTGSISLSVLNPNNLTSLEQVGCRT